MRKKAYKKLKSIFKDRYLDEKIDTIQYAYDATQKMYPPDVVIFPKTTEEVSQAMKIAYKYSIPVVPRGWGSGFSGGALNIDGGICMSLELMNKVIEIDDDNLIATVEAGLVNYELQEILKPHGLFFPPDPSSWKFSTIGGNIAENAGGPRAVKYGVMKDWVMGLELVLADGSIIRSGSKNVKDVAGYNITHLIVGSEGTLAVVTKALLKLYPIPEYKKTMQVVFDDMSRAAQTVSSIIKNKIIPTSIEFIDRDAIKTVESALHIGLPKADAILVIEVDGDLCSVDESVNKIEMLCKQGGAINFQVAQDEKEADELWIARRSISPTLKRIADGKLNEDIVVPRSKLAEMIKLSQDISKKYNLSIVNFGHAGDGNIHVNIMYHTDKKDEVEKADKAMNDIFDACLSLGGAISGEHGIGITKDAFLEKQLGQRSINLFKDIKRAFDPKNIINPHKMKL